MTGSLNRKTLIGLKLFLTLKPIETMFQKTISHLNREYLNFLSLILAMQ